MNGQAVTTRNFERDSLILNASSSGGEVATMTRCLTAAKALAPFLLAELAVLAIQWFVVPENSWASYLLAPVTLIALPLLAAVRLARASFKTGPAVLSALTFTALGVVWATCAAALGTGIDWRTYLLGVLISAVPVAAPVQLLAAYVGTRYVRYTVDAAMSELGTLAASDAPPARR